MTITATDRGRKQKRHLRLAEDQRRALVGHHPSQKQDQSQNRRRKGFKQHPVFRFDVPSDPSIPRAGCSIGKPTHVNRKGDTTSPRCRQRRVYLGCFIRHQTASCPVLPRHGPSDIKTRRSWDDGRQLGFARGLKEDFLQVRVVGPAPPNCCRISASVPCR